jgi:5-methylcytosine-specific restriction protein A
MPHAPAYPCTMPGCPNRQPCPKHRRRREQRGYYDTRAWRALSKAQLQREPWCRVCLYNGEQVKGSVADHIVPRRDGGADALTNLQTLCRRHDQVKRRSERRD